MSIKRMLNTKLFFGGPSVCYQLYYVVRKFIYEIVEVYLLVSYSTDMPTASMGKWILDKIDEMTPVHINLIRNLYRKLQEYKRKPLTDHVMRMIKEYQRDLDIARRYQPPIKPLPGKTKEYTVFYGEYDVFDNLEVLGEERLRVRLILQRIRTNTKHILQTPLIHCG
ncbi:hypothetical protein [Bacteroides bouchesdurhonensis]|uniref:hypothetical protein n=2 Tax=Bacteroides bouchesdurhonensis TaxID=1841855 RepID=UPI0022E08337|nr:hypothetical protein [Bacteroides bouchesdurhonensis]